jgi:predicted MFS family arabinose efflux permease
LTSTTASARASTTDRSASWAGVVALSLGIFAIVMSEVLPASLLPRIVTVCNVAIAVGAIVGGVLVDEVAANVPLLVGGIGSIVGAALLTSLRRRG